MSIVVTEPVFLETEDGRTVLAAAVGDELTPAQAEALKVGKDGKSKNGVGPAEDLARRDERELPGAFGRDADAEVEASRAGRQAPVLPADAAEPGPVTSGRAKGRSSKDEES